MLPAFRMAHLCHGRSILPARVGLNARSGVGRGSIGDKASVFGHSRGGGSFESLAI